MISDILPVNAEWIHQHIVTPYLEGVERMNRAWLGANLHVLPKAYLNLKERVWEWLTGFFISLPFVGAIIWIGWKTFGDPERLSDPYFPDPFTPSTHLAPISDLDDLSLSITPNTTSSSHLDAKRVLMEEITLSFDETRPESHVKANWRIENYPNQTIAIKTSARGKWTASYSPDGIIREVNEKRKDGNHCFIKQIDSDHLWVKIVRNGEIIEEKHKIPKPFVWIQQPEIGMKKFILSHEKEIRFCTVRSDTGELVYLKATKEKIDEIDRYGSTMKLKGEFDFSQFSWFDPKYYLLKTLSGVVSCDTWYDLKTGILRKFIAAWHPFGSFTVEFEKLS